MGACGCMYCVLPMCVCVCECVHGRGRGEASEVRVHSPGSTPPGVQVLQSGESSANSTLSRTHHPLQSPPVLRRAVAEPDSDAPCEHALHRTSIEGLKYRPCSVAM